MESQIGANRMALLKLQNGASFLNAFSDMAESESGRRGERTGRGKSQPKRERTKERKKERKEKKRKKERKKERKKKKTASVQYCHYIFVDYEDIG